MDIARERFLDPTRDYHLTLGLRSRTAAMHSVLSGLSPADREQIAAVLASALDAIEAIVRPGMPEGAAVARPDPVGHDDGIR